MQQNGSGDLVSSRATFRIGIKTQIIFTVKCPPFSMVAAQEIYMLLMTDGRGTSTSYFEILSNRMKNGQNEARLKTLRGPHSPKML